MQLTRTQSFLRTALQFAVVLLCVLTIAVPSSALAQFAAIGNIINAVVFNTVMMIGGMFVYVGGLALDTAIEQFVIGMGSWMLGNAGIAVNEIWIVIRDTFNLLFIFSLILIGLKLIWNSEDSGTKRALGSLIVAALLINFSLFFAKFIVDFANVAAVQIYAVMADNVQALVTDVDAGGGTFQVVAGWDITGVAGYLMQLVNLQSAGGAEGLTNPDASPSIGYSIMLLIFLLFAALIFFAGALMLTLRFALLLIYMMGSPFMFLGLILPRFKSLAMKWWEGFLRQAFFAPAYLFMIYISFRVLTGFHAQGFGNAATGNVINNPSGAFASTGAGGAGGPEAGSFLSIIFLFLSLTFMVLSIWVAQKMSIAGADQSMKLIQGARQRTQRALTQPARYAARNATNKTGMAMERGITRLQSAPAAKTKLGQFIQNNTTKSSSLDQSVRTTAKQLKGAKYGLATTVGENRQTQAEIKSRTETRTAIDTGLATQAALRQNPGVTATSDQEAAIRELRKTVTGMSIKQLEEMTDAERTAIAHEMTTSQVDKLMDSKELDSGDKAQLMGARQEFLKSNVLNNGKMMSAELVKLNTAQLETLGDTFIEENAEHLSASQMDDLKKNSKRFTESQKEVFEQKRVARLKETTAISETDAQDPAKLAAKRTQARAAFVTTKRDPANPANVVEDKPRKASEIAAMPRDILLSPASRTNLTPEVLEQILEKKTLNFTDRVKLRKEILADPETTEEAKGYLLTPFVADRWGTEKPAATPAQPAPASPQAGYQVTPGGVIVPAGQTTNNTP